MILALIGCTALHSAVPGPGADEVYVLASQTFGPSYVLHCAEIELEGKLLVRCVRVIDEAEAGTLAPGGPGAKTFTR